MDANIIAILRDTLTNLYSDELKIRTIIDDSGINASLITFNAAAKYIWHSVLKEADKTDRVDALLDVVNKDYPTNKEFQKACKAYEYAKPFDIYQQLSQENYGAPPESERLNTEEYAFSTSENKKSEIKGGLKNPLDRDTNEVKAWFFNELHPKEQSLLLTVALFEGMSRQKLLEVMTDIEQILSTDA